MFLFFFSFLDVFITGNNDSLVLRYSSKLVMVLKKKKKKSFLRYFCFFIKAKTVQNFCFHASSKQEQNQTVDCKETPLLLGKSTDN